MIVAGAEMHVAAQLARFAADHEADLGVRLELDEAVDDLHAGALEIARPADIGLFVEARLQLDERGDGLAGFGGLDERAHDRAVLAGAVERLLDRDDVGIGRGLAQELDDDVEAFERMMDDEVLRLDRGEAIAAVIADALGKARRVGLEQQIGALVEDELAWSRRGREALRR